IAGSAEAHVCQVVFGLAAVAVADLHALRTGANERLSDEGVDVARLALAMDAKFHNLVSVLFQGRAPNLTLETANPAAGVGDGTVNTANPPVATDFVDSLVPVDRFPSLYSRHEAHSPTPVSVTPVPSKAS